jgi:ceramide glucosyltransferase
MVRQARHGVLVMSDADIVAGPTWLAEVIDALAPPDVGAVTCLYVGAAGAGFWSNLGAMAINYNFLPGVALGQALGLATPCFGSTIALTSRTLEAIGGFQAFADHLADDYEIGRAVRATGLRVATPPLAVSHLCIETSGRELAAHELRWNRTVRQIDPTGYAGSLLTHPLAFALMGAALLGAPAWTLGFVAAVIAARIVAKAVIDRATGAPVGAWWLLPARDVLSFVLFAAAFAVNTVHWQGRRFRVGPDGELIHA